MVTDEDNKYSFYIIDNYKIEFYRTKSQFSYSKYSQYHFKILFKELNTDLVLVQIDTNEKRMYDLVINMYQYNMYSVYQIYNESVWFDANLNGDIFILEVEDLNDSILEFEEIEVYKTKLTLQQYNQYTGIQLPRLTITMNQYQFEEFIAQAWLVLEGIESIRDICRSELDEYLDFFCENNDAINYI